MRILALLALALLACEPEPVFKAGWPTLDPARREAMLAEPTGPVDVVIDTDLTNEIDDEFAVAYALLAPERLRVQAIYATPHSIWPELLDTGLSVLDRRALVERLEGLGIPLDAIPRTDPARGMRSAYVQAVRIAELMAVDVPVFEGAPGYLADAETPIATAATEDLIARAREDRDGPLYVVALGAITNVASALLAAPDIVDDVVVIWTSAYPTFWERPNASYNLAQDLHAARVVLDSGVPFVYLPGFYVGEELRVTRPEMVEYVAGRGSLGEFLFDLYDNQLGAGDHYARSKVIWDLIPFAWLIDPNWLHTELVPTPRLDTELRWQPRDGAPLMREALDIRRDAVFGDFYQRLEAWAADPPGMDTPP